MLRFIRALDSDEKEAFFAEIGAGSVYLYQLTNLASPNPTLKLALAIEAETARLGRQKGIPPVSLQDLLVGRIKVTRTKDHTTGEVFAMLPNGDLVRRRVDKLGRIVLVDDQGGIIHVEEAYPAPKTLATTRPLES